MISIDNIDKKIIFELFLNCRQSYREIGRKAHVSKNVVNYRVNRLIEKGLITNFLTVVNSQKLGYICPRLHITFQNTTQKIEEKIINFFVNKPSCNFVVTTEGAFDLTIMFALQNLNHFYLAWEDAREKFRNYFDKQSLSFFLYDITYEPQYLLENEIRRKFHKSFLRDAFDRVPYDHIDLQILNHLSSNARKSFPKIANSIGISSSTVINRIRNLEQKGVITGLSIDINISVIGYQNYKLYIYLNDYKKKSKIIEYVEHFPNLLRIDFTTGESDLELEFHLQNYELIDKIVNSIKNEFPEIIKNYRYSCCKKIYKNKYLPEIIH